MRATGGRITGIDLARSLAIFGMFAVHVGPTDANGPLGGLYSLPHGRASLLFVLVAGIGVSLLFDSPRTTPGEARGRLLWRVVLLLPLGLALQELDHGAAVILQDYAVLFLVALVAVTLPGRWLLGLALAAVPLGSVGFLWGHLTFPAEFARQSIAWSDPVADIAHRLVLSGPYPLITWIGPFLFGLWLGRRDLRSQAVRLRLLGWGAGVAVVTLLVSMVLRAWLGAGGEPSGWEHLVVATPHSQMPFWLVASTGAASAVLGASLWLADRARRLAQPFVLTGQLALTVYVGHLLALHAAHEGLTSDDVVPAIGILAGFVLVSLALATLWRSAFAHGPLEVLLRLPWRGRRGR